MTELKHIVVIGASAGGFNTITKLLGALPANMPAAIFIVMHLSRASSTEVIINHFEKHTPYPCRIPHINEPIKAGTIYLAPADFHMLIKPGIVSLTKGPHENRWRPSIDVLFRSAAAAYNSRAIGVVLSGMLDDGTSGMSAIKRCGGTCIVQEPLEADYQDMPQNVINHVEVDYRVPVTDIGYILDDIFSKDAKPDHEVPDDVKLEAQITERMTSSIDDLKKIGVHSNYTCPDCGGGLWEINNEPQPRYRCHTGHVYTAKLLLEKQTEELEETLWVSIRMMEERRNLLVNLARHEEEVGRSSAAQSQQTRIDDLNDHIERLKTLLVSINKNGPGDAGYN